MDQAVIEALAYDEAQRLMEKNFYFHNPYSCVIDDEGIPFNKRETFYQMVEDALLEKGEKIDRQGQFFKIARYQDFQKKAHN